MIVLQIRRGLKADLPALQIHELGWCIDTLELFMGTSTGNKLIAGGYTPVNAGDWSGPVPETIFEALDRLANEVAILKGGPIA